MIVGFKKWKISKDQFVNMIYINVHLNFVMKIKIEKWAKYVYIFTEFFFKVNIWKIIILESIIIFIKDSMFQVKLIRLVDLNELKDSYFYHLFSSIIFFLIVILYFFLLSSVSLSLSLVYFKRDLVWWCINNYDPFHLFATFYIHTGLTPGIGQKTVFSLQYTWVQMYPPIY